MIALIIKENKENNIFELSSDFEEIELELETTTYPKKKQPSGFDPIHFLSYNNNINNTTDNASLDNTTDPAIWTKNTTDDDASFNNRCGDNIGVASDSFSSNTSNTTSSATQSAVVGDGRGRGDSGTGRIIRTNSVGGKSNKSVSFHDDESLMNTYCDVIHRNEYTEQEKSDAFYNKRDIAEMKNRVKSDSFLIESGLSELIDDGCERGLECRTLYGITKKNRNRTRAFLAVKLEILSQKEIGYTNHQMIADVYREYSIPCHKSAQLIGQQDAIAAKS